MVLDPNTDTETVGRKSFYRVETRGLVTAVEAGGELKRREGEQEEARL